MEIRVVMLQIYISIKQTILMQILFLSPRKRMLFDRLTFSDYLNTWIPKEAISTYLNSKARINIRNTDQPDWLLYLKQMWIGKHGIYSPDYFDGIEKDARSR